MTQTAFQKALDGLEDQIFRLPTHRRGECIDRTLAHMRRTLPTDYRRTQRCEFRRLAHDSQSYHHHAIVDAVNAFPSMRDRCVVSVAQSHGQRLWWLPFLLLWNSVTSGIDVFEYGLNWYLVTRRWFPRFALGPVIAATAMICSDVRRMQAAGSRVPSWCLAWQRAPVVAVKVCAWRIGWLSGWQWLRGDGGSTKGDQPDYSLMPAVLRVGLAALMLCALLAPQHTEAGVITAAISAATSWEIQTGGSDTNGGGYSSGGSDYSQQVSPQVSVADAVANGTTTVTSATASFTSAMVGNVCYIQGGTGSIAAGWYQVASYTNSTTIVVDRSTGLTTGTGVTLKLGGALASPGQASALVVTQNKQYFKAGTYTISSTTANTSTGRISASADCVWEGYQTTRGDLGTAPIFKVAATGFTSSTVMNLNSTGSQARNIVVDGNSKTSIIGLDGSVSPTYYKCGAINCTSMGCAGTSFVRSYATVCATGFNATSGYVLFACEIYNNTSGGVSFSNANAVMCLSYGNTGVGFTLTTHGNITNCITYGNSSHGVNVTAGTRANTLSNVIAEGNGGYGFTGNGTVRTNVQLFQCAGYNNTSGNVNVSDLTGLNSGFVTGTASFFTNAAGSDFSLNTTAGGGAALRAVGFPGAFPRGLTTGYIDVGAAQHADPAVQTVVRFPASLDGGMV